MEKAKAVEKKVSQTMLNTIEVGGWGSIGLFTGLVGLFPGLILGEMYKKVKGKKVNDDQDDDEETPKA